MVDTITNLAGERLVRRAPDHPLALSEEDQRYLLDGLAEVARVFGVAAVPEVPLDILPGRALMRRMVELRMSLRARDPEQREALGRLTSAILLVDTACALDHDHAAALAARHAKPKDLS